MNGVWLRESFFLSVYNSISIELVTEGLPWWWSHPGQSQIRVLSWIAYSYHPVKKAWQAIAELHQSWYCWLFEAIVHVSDDRILYKCTICYCMTKWKLVQPYGTSISLTHWTPTPLPLFLFLTTGFCDLQGTGWYTRKAESVQGV